MSASRDHATTRAGDPALPQAHHERDRELAGNQVATVAHGGDEVRATKCLLGPPELSPRQPPTLPRPAEQAGTALAPWMMSWGERKQIVDAPDSRFRAATRILRLHAPPLLGAENSNAAIAREALTGRLVPDTSSRASTRSVRCSVVANAIARTSAQLAIASLQM